MSFVVRLAVVVGLVVSSSSLGFAQISNAPYPPPEQTWPGAGPQPNPYTMPPFQYGPNPYVPGTVPAAEPLCELTFTEAVVGKVSPGVYQLAWLNFVNKGEATVARLTLFVGDGREILRTLSLPRGRTSLQLHEFFDLETGITAFSVDVAFTTTRVRAGVTHRMSNEPWHVFNIAELPACSVASEGTP